MTFLLRNAAGLFLIAAIAYLAFKSISGASYERLMSAMAESKRLDIEEASIKERLKAISAISMSAVSMPRDLLWEADPNGSIELMMQETLLGIAKDAGLRLSSFGASEGLKVTNQPTAAYQLEGVAGHAELAKFLAGIERSSPRLAVSSLWIRQVAPDQGEVEAPIDLRMTVWAFQQEKR